MDAEKKEPKNVSDLNPYNIQYDNYLDTNACTECTGLMHRAPDGRREWDAYRDVFDFTAKPPAPDQEQNKTNH